MKTPTFIVYCDKCKKPVEEIAQELDYSTLEYYFIVKCHGEIDQCRVGTYFFEEARQVSAVAFTTERIEYGI